MVPGSGVSYRIADDVDGANASDWSADDGLVDEGRYIQARATASTLPSTTFTATLTVNGWANSFEIVTASSAAFPEVDNTATARSVRVGTPPSAAGNKWLIMGLRFKHDTVGAGNQAIVTQGGGGSALHFQMMGGTNYRVRLSVSTAFNASLSMTPDTNWHTVLIAIDLNQAVAADTLRVYRDGSVVSVSGSPTLPTGGALSFNQNDFADIALFGETDEGQLFDGKSAFTYLHWGTGAIPIDISDPAVRDKFTADLIDVGGRGRGPTGTQPKVYVSGDAAAYNAGIANEGSLGGTFAKAVGTYA